MYEIIIFVRGKRNLAIAKQLKKESAMIPVPSMGAEVIHVGAKLRNITLNTSANK